MKKEYPQVAYGAVYFRKSNPPREDWDRDYARAAADGMNMFRHWFLWGAIETSPGHYDWSDYDRHMDLAAKNGIGTVIAEFSDSVPEWFFHENKDCFSVFRDGTQAPYSGLSGSCATGGFVPGGLCLDNPKAKEYAGGFLRALAAHYKGHPALFGYDVWNECNYNPDTCFCEHTRQKFCEWLKIKYGSLKNLGEAWYRYSYADWAHVRAPRFVAQSPECMDWLAFRKENYYENFQWKVKLLQAADPDARITAHGVAASLDYTYGDGNDDWMAASQAESYGMTWVMGRKGTEPWKQWQAADLVRSGARGKVFWHAEMQGGPLWLQPQVIGREKEDGRVADASDIRLWNLVSLAGGARGVLYLRWRSLLDGQLFSSFGLYSDDGFPNERSEMASKIAKWANSPQTADLFAAQPQKADAGIIILDQIQEFSRTMQQAGEGKFYAKCQWGAYRIFFDSHIPVDFVHFDDIDKYGTLYFAYPIQLNAGQALKLKAWVKNGGTLICEGLPGYFGDRGKVCVRQPGNGLDELFGVSQKSVEFMPDIGDRIRFSALGFDGLPGGLFRQSYSLAGAASLGAYPDGETVVTQSQYGAGTAVLGTYPDGEIAMTISQYGAGTAVLIGTFPSEAYFRTSSAPLKAMFGELFERLGLRTPAAVDNPHVHARLCAGVGKRFLWLINHSPERQSAAVTIAGVKGVGGVMWGASDSFSITEGVIHASIPGKDALVLELQS